MGNQHVFVTGATGFVGSSVIANLLSRGWQVTALTRGRDVPGARTVRVDLFDAPALAREMSGCTAVVHLVGIIQERPSDGVTFQRLHVQATQSVVSAATAAGIHRYCHMSALGTREGAANAYHGTKWQAEQRVRESGLAWTIFRPSIIHGPGGEFMRMVAGWARGTKAPYFFMPYFGAGVTGLGGAGKLQPIYVADVARAFADSIENPATVGQTYELGGPTVMTWPEMHRIASRVIRGEAKRTMPLPAWYAKLLTRVAPGSLLPFNRDQVLMSQEDNTGDLTAFRRDFRWEPADFETTLQQYARDL